MANNIIVSYEDKDSVYFKMECSCMEHYLTYCLEWDSACSEYLLTLKDHTVIGNFEDTSRNKFQHIWQRIKWAYAVLTGKPTPLLYGFRFKGKDQVQDLLDYLDFAWKRIQHNTDIDNQMNK